MITIAKINHRHEAIAKVSSYFKAKGVTLPHGAAGRIARKRPMTATMMHTITRKLTPVAK